jgi:hypothetical protein
VGVLAATRALLDEARALVGVEIAPVVLASEPVEWRVSRYYRDEMGDDIWRQFLALDTRIDPTELAALKLRTGVLEGRWRSPHGRAVNLDPGYLDLLRVVLASTKDAAHRVAVGHGIYAEATLHFVNGRFVPWPYTYPDYAAPAALDFFTEVRVRFRAASRER